VLHRIIDGNDIEIIIRKRHLSPIHLLEMDVFRIGYGWSNLKSSSKREPLTCSSINARAFSDVFMRIDHPASSRWKMFPMHSFPGVSTLA
jgi:hypothetical protein